MRSHLTTNAEFYSIENFNAYEKLAIQFPDNAWNSKRKSNWKTFWNYSKRIFIISTLRCSNKIFHALALASNFIFFPFCSKINVWHLQWEFSFSFPHNAWVMSKWLNNQLIQKFSSWSRKMSRMLWCNFKLPWQECIKISAFAFLSVLHWNFLPFSPQSVFLFLFIHSICFVCFLPSHYSYVCSFAVCSHIKSQQKTTILRCFNEKPPNKISFVRENDALSENLLWKLLILFFLSLLLFCSLCRSFMKDTRVKITTR